VGIEVEGMLSGKDARPALALEALAALGLAGTVFVPPGLVEEGEGEEGGWLSVGVAGVRLANWLLWRRERGGEGGMEEAELLEGILCSEDADELRLWPDGTDDGVAGAQPQQQEQDQEGQQEGQQPVFRLLSLTRAEGYRRPRRAHRLLFLAAVLLGWAGRSCPDPQAKGGNSNSNSKSKKDKRVPAVQLIVREALKLRARDAEEAVLLHALLPRFRALAAAAAAAPVEGGGGSGVERCVRVWFVCWKKQGWFGSGSGGGMAVSCSIGFEGAPCAS
jgi:hypothetical protein